MTGSVADASAASGTEVGYPNGHLGHLKPEEQEALESFKTYLAEKGYYKPGPLASHDDQTLLRYLRARRWNVVDAFKQFKETEDWRKANGLSVLYDTIDLEAYEASRRLYPQWTGRRDRRGIPLYLFEIRHLDSKTVSAYEKAAETSPSKAVTDGHTSPKLLRLFALYENLTRFAQPLCTELGDRPHATTTPITLSTNIVDISGVSLKQFWNLKSHMQAASQLATAHYPETLDRIFIIGAPHFFSTVWGWIKRWFDPITVSKIFILGPHEVKATLEEFIDPKNIPKQYGGELDFTWGDQPKTDPYIKERVKWENGLTDFPQGPKYWRPTADGTRMECVAVGSEGGKQRMVNVGTLERICNVKKDVSGGVDAEALAEEVKGLSVGGGDDEKKEIVETGEEAKVPAVSA
ncbi:CRAL-TRIO domain-containing protein [Copromyces sp. CBS 386.78]|nr:CRAL-TRIO domain-containing protein [Copromyces sp. CBS 386.78]